MEIKRGDIFWVALDYDSPVGSEQKGWRPVLIVQNDIGNKISPTVIIATITTTQPRRDYPFLFQVGPKESGLKETSFIQLNQIRTISKGRLEEKVGHLAERLMLLVDEALKISLGLRKIQ